MNIQVISNSESSQFLSLIFSIFVPEQKLSF